MTIYLNILPGFCFDTYSEIVILFYSEVKIMKSSMKMSHLISIFQNKTLKLKLVFVFLTISGLAQAENKVKDFSSLKDMSLNFMRTLLSSDDSAPGCEYLLQRSDEIMISRQYSVTTGFCYLSIRPFNPKNLTYRSFLFTNDGMLMIFNSFGPGTVSETTGAREYYLFPRLSEFPELEILTGGDVLVRAQSGHEFIFNAAAFQLKSVSEARFTQDLNINKKNKGGIELQLDRGLLLDLGFVMGQSPADNSNRSVFFKDRNQNSCVVKNKDVFNYRDDDVYLDMTDTQLKAKFQKQCSKLEFGF